MTSVAEGMRAHESSREGAISRLLNSRMLWLPGAIAGVLVGLAFLVAAYTKAADPMGFAAQIAREGYLPAALAYPGGIAIVALELGLALGLVFLFRHPLVLLLTTGLMGVFVGMAAWDYAFPPEDATSCGCFGNFVQQDPAQHLLTNLVLFGLCLVAWLGSRARRGGTWRWAIVALGIVGGGAFALAAPSLPIDGWPGVTLLERGASVESLGITDVIPELGEGRELVLVIDRADEDTRAAMARVNEHLALVGGETSVYGIAEENEELAVEFLWTAGPAFDVRGAPYGMIKPLYRSLPRAFLAVDGEVVRVWNEIPPAEELDALAEGRQP